MFAGRDIEPIRQRLKNLMAEAGLPYGERTHTYNSRLAQELGAWADTQPGGEAIHDALYRAYFVDAVNISDVDALIEIAEAVGLDGVAARAVLVERSFSAKVDEDWARSRGVGVTGVPTFLQTTSLWSAVSRMRRSRNLFSICSLGMKKKVKPTPYHAVLTIAQC
jgi:predicted DsbA family dithiol-disulfide isomerase